MPDRPLDAKRALVEADLDPDPIMQFRQWYDEAAAAGEPEPDAMALATATAEGSPSLRFVLMRGLDERGFVFYTNGHSRKGRELSANPVAALAFRWWLVERQVRVTGSVSPIEAAESDAYFRTRPRGAQIGAWASSQSDLLDNRSVLDRQYEAVEHRFAGREVPRPPWWGGYTVRPEEVEFWQGRPDRLHDRLRYHLLGKQWTIYRLSP